MMRNLVLALSITALTASAVSAADLEAVPYTQAPMIAPGWDFSGFYYGLNAGYGTSNNCWDLVPTAGALGREPINWMG
jgi:outer membrane immunogenic protein